MMDARVERVKRAVCEDGFVYKKKIVNKSLCEVEWVKISFQVCLFGWTCKWER